MLEITLVLLMLDHEDFKVRNTADQYLHQSKHILVLSLGVQSPSLEVRRRCEPTYRLLHEQWWLSNIIKDAEVPFIDNHPAYKTRQSEIRDRFPADADTTDQQKQDLTRKFLLDQYYEGKTSLEYAQHLYFNWRSYDWIEKKAKAQKR